MPSSLERNRKIIGISNTYTRETGKEPAHWLSHARDGIVDIFQGVGTITVIPYALDDMDSYAAKLNEAFKNLGFAGVVSVHQQPGNEIEAIENAEAVFIPGGNTPRLITNLHGLRNADGSMVDKRPSANKQSIISVLRKRVAEGMPIGGASAGLNALTPLGGSTTNDMHIAHTVVGDGVVVSRLDTLGVLPFSINPHYQDAIKIEDDKTREQIAKIAPYVLAHLDHQGETRSTRLTEATEMSPERPILALRESAYIVVKGMSMFLRGTTGGVLFEAGKESREFAPDSDLSELLILTKTGE